MTTVYKFEPLNDPRWEDFLQRHPRASVFHSRGWLKALRRTYGYQPVVFTTTPPTIQLADGLLFCRVNSWLTGRRLVSLPFSDHCDPLVAGAEEFGALLRAVGSLRSQESLKSIEIRPLDGDSLFRTSNPGFRKGERFYYHRIDLTLATRELYQRFHKDCVQRKIRRAEREKLAYQEGRSEELLGCFYHLLTLTRRRHQLPPQPQIWFRNLVDCVGENAKIRLCFKERQPVAAMITLTHKGTMVYKYGCSDARFHNLGGMPFLFWQAIQEAKAAGALQFDLGRTDCDNAGLATFKEHLGGSRSLITYHNFPPLSSSGKVKGWKIRASKQLFRWMPNSLLGTTGRILYKHMG